MNKRFAAVALLIAVIVGCASDTSTQYTREGVAYGVTEGVFRGRWWSYYERGSSFLSGEYLDESARDFQKALDGRSRDTWRARTYGLHFVEYFPNRELGVVRYRQDRLDEAEQYLTRSLEQVDTARAHHFLDQVKKKKIAQGVIKDNSAPVLTAALIETKPLAPPVLEPPAPAPAPEAAKPAPEAPKPAPAPKPAAPKPAAKQPVVVASSELTVQIAAKDDVGVANVTVNGQEVHQRGSQTEMQPQQAVVLSEGKHEIEVTATDLADKKTVEKVEVTVDLTGPTIGVFSPIEPTVTDHGTVILEGATVDKNGVVTVTAGGRMLAESPGAPRLEFDSELPLGDGENIFVLAARDVAGNETRSAVKVFKGDPDSAQAKLWLLQQKHPERMHLALANPAMLDVLLAQTAAPVSEIRLKSPVPEQPYRNSRALRIAGEVVTQTKVTAITINGEPFTDLTGAPKESFNRRIPIDEKALQDGAGTISVAIHAEDGAGAALDKNFDVTVRPVALSTPDTKMPVAVLAFAGQGVEQPLGEYLRVTTEGQFVAQQRFRVVERTRLQEVLTEQQLSAGLADPNQALALGKVIPAQVFIVADVFPRDEKGVEIKARAISTETSDVIATLDEFAENKDDREALKFKCDSLAAQLAKLFPRLSGEVVDARETAGGTEMLLSWTQEDGVRQGTYLLLVHESEPWIDESTGEVLEPGELTPVGRAQITNVSASNTRARVVPVENQQEGVKVEKGMPAITM
jgi:hypothetical protein